MEGDGTTRKMMAVDGMTIHGDVRDCQINVQEGITILGRAEPISCPNCGIYLELRAVLVDPRARGSIGSIGSRGTPEEHEAMERAALERAGRVSTPE